MGQKDLRKFVEGILVSPPKPEMSGFTLYIEKSLFDKIERLRSKLGLNRQEIMRKLVEAGFEQFMAAIPDKVKKEHQL